MTRTNATRTDLIQARQSAIRAGLAAYRIPEVYSSLGVTSLYDWREAFANRISTSPIDPIGGYDQSYRGTTAITSVFTAGLYEADLESTATDYFRTSAVHKTGSAATFGAITIFGWFKMEQLNSTKTIISRWRPSGSSRSWQIRLLSTNQFAFFASTAGTALSLQINSDLVINDNNWHFFTLVNRQSDNTLKMYIDGVDQPYTFATGTVAITIADPNVETWVGGLADASNNPTFTFDGRLGMVGYARGTAWTFEQSEMVRNMTRSIGGYV